MSSEQPRRSRDTTGSAGSPMGSTAAIIIAIVAVEAGFLILRQLRSDDDSAAITTAPIATPAVTESTLAPVVTPAPVTAPPTSVIVTTGATVMVANASRVDGAAGVLTTALTGQQFTMAKAGNSTVKQEVTTVLYDAANPEALAVASSISALMGNVVVEVMPAQPPVDGGVLPEGVTVLVLLGSDKANLTLPDMSAPATTVAGGTATTVPAVGETTTTAAP